MGCGGSGKTVVGRQLAELIDAPLTHLDGVYYDADWNPLPQEKFAALQEELVARPRWVIDGNYASTLPVRLKRADTVIFLDIPRSSACSASCSDAGATAAASTPPRASSTASPGASSATSSAIGARCGPRSAR